MDSFEEILSREYGKNSVQAYLIAAGVIVLGLLLIRIFRRFIMTKVEKMVAKSPSQTDDQVVAGVEKFVLPILSFMVVYWGINSLELSVKASRVVEVATGVVIMFFVLRFISTTIKIILTNHIRKQ